jgi:predicted ribosome quality control (RQC) complex YloA/Tae2 family protein
MKSSLSSLDVMAIVRELQALVGGRVDKIYHPSLDHLVLSIRMAEERRTFLHFVLGRWLYRSDASGEMPQRPSDFAMMLRKRITNAEILGVKQQGFDRIVVVSLRKDEVYDLVLEIFGDGNVILVKDGTIVQPLTSHTWKHRDVRAKRPFAFPPPVPDPGNLSPTSLLDILRSSDTDLVRTLATKLNMGGRYSEEIIARAGLKKEQRAADVQEHDAGRLLEAFSAIRSELEASRNGYIVRKNGALEDVVPIRLTTHSGLDHEEFASFSAAISAYAAQAPPAKPEEPRERVLESARLKRKIAQQEAAARRLQDESRAMQLAGDTIFANYEQVSRALSIASKEDVAAADLEKIPGFAGFDRRSSTLKLKTLSGTMELDVKSSLQANARNHYEAAKKARKKLEGVLSALKEARRELEGLEKSDLASSSETKKKATPTRPFWFERFRWFISSEGAVVLGGKDAKSNDMLVKKHLKPGDRYAHADVHGAPSVVVKMAEGVTEKTLLEACEFAVATSRAWNAKLGSSAGYWVLPEQVSKTPQSGEYLAKGAFVIRGKRNYSDKLEIKLGVGEIMFEGHRKMMCGPESAVRAHSKRFVIIRPGDTDKNDFAKRLAEAFEVPIEEIQRILPPGDVEVAETSGVVIS